MKKKLIVLGVSLIGVVLLHVSFNLRSLGICSQNCPSDILLYRDLLLLFPFLLFFSLVTLKLEYNVYKYWFKFILFAVPIIVLMKIIVLTGINNDESSRVMRIVDLSKIVPYLFIYTTFIIGSLIAIYRGYRQSKMGGKGTGAAVDARRVI